MCVWWCEGGGVCVCVCGGVKGVVCVCVCVCGGAWRGWCECMYAHNKIV